VTAFSNPARQALVANLVPRKHLANAMSLNNVMWQVATIAGPALAGSILLASGPGLVYLINSVSFGAMLIALMMLTYRGAPAANSATLSRDSLVEGIRFTFDSHVIRSTMMLDFFATFFSSARTMLPVVANEMLHSGVQGFAILSTAQSVGAVIAAMVMSLRKEVERQGFVLLVSVAIYGLATALFGLSVWFSVSYILLALTGAADTVSTVIRSTLRQMITPDHLRGRMTGVNMIFFSGGPQLGELEAGLVAALWGVPFSIISGGVATVFLTLLIAWQYPTLRNYVREGSTEAARA
jgi:MFS family permease